MNILATHLALPREGHLDALFHIFAYLKGKHNTRMVFDPTYPEVDMRVFNECDWRKSFYGDAKEAIPPDMPKPRGKMVDTTLYVDSDHAGDKMTRTPSATILNSNIRTKQGLFITLFFHLQVVSLARSYTSLI